MSAFNPGDIVRCTSTWTTGFIDCGDEYTVEDFDPADRTILINGQWVPVGYFEKVEPVINWAEIAGTMTARAVNAERRAEKAEASLRESDAALQAARRTIQRVEALAYEYEAKSPVWASTVAPRIRRALKED